MRRLHFLTLLFAVGGGLGPDLVQSIWNCNHTDGEVRKYDCFRGQLGQQTVDVLGLFLVEKGAAGEITLPATPYGVRVISPHTLDFDKLATAVKEVWSKKKPLWSPASWPGEVVTGWVFEPHVVKNESRKVQAGNTTAGIEPKQKFLSVVYQYSGMCTYKKSVRDGYTYSNLVKPGVHVWSAPLVNTIVVGGSQTKCVDWLLKIEAALDSKSGNNTYIYYEGVKQNPSPDMFAPYQKGDTVAFIKKLKTELAESDLHPSPATGLNWSEYTLKEEYGLREKVFNFSNPSNRSVQVFQAVTNCGGLDVYARPLPVFPPLSPTRPARFPDLAKVIQECESPVMPKGCVMYNWRPSSPEAAVQSNDCEDQFWVTSEEYDDGKEPRQVVINYGLEGPFADGDGDYKLDDAFRSTLKKKLVQMGVTKAKEGAHLFNYYGTGFNWTQFGGDTKLSMSPYAKNSKIVQVPTSPDAEKIRLVVFQLVARCGPYFVYTDQVAVVQYEFRHQPYTCVAVDELPGFSCDKMEKWLKSFPKIPYSHF